VESVSASRAAVLSFPGLQEVAEPSSLGVHAFCDLSPLVDLHLTAIYGLKQK
jgi:hypothetical protein